MYLYLFRHTAAIVLNSHGTENMYVKLILVMWSFSCLSHRYYVQKYSSVLQYSNTDNVILFRCNLVALAG